MDTTVGEKNGLLRGTDQYAKSWDEHNKVSSTIRNIEPSLLAACIVGRQLRACLATDGRRVGGEMAKPRINLKSGLQMVPAWGALSLFLRWR
jgi:hypothetical protein